MWILFGISILLMVSVMIGHLYKHHLRDWSLLRKRSLYFQGLCPVCEIGCYVMELNAILGWPEYSCSKCGDITDAVEEIL